MTKEGSRKLELFLARPATLLTVEKMNKIVNTQRCQRLLKQSFSKPKTTLSYESRYESDDRGIESSLNIWGKRGHWHPVASPAGWLAERSNVNMTPSKASGKNKM